MKLFMMQFSPSPVTFFLLGPNIPIGTLRLLLGLETRLYVEEWHKAAVAE
jgi:hypothetical protein